jgi:hypothetical protein
MKGRLVGLKARANGAEWYGMGWRGRCPSSMEGPWKMSWFGQVEDQDIDIGYAMFHVAFSSPSRDGEIEFALGSPVYKGEDLCGHMKLGAMGAWMRTYKE